MHLSVPLLIPTVVAGLIAVITLSANALPTTTPATTTPATTTSVSAAYSGRLPTARTPPASATETATVTGTPSSAAFAPTVRSTREALTFTWPLSPRPTVQRRFEQPQDRWARGHRGVDLLAGVGQPVLSAGEGVVAFSGVLAGRGVITVRHSGGVRTTYEPVDERLAFGAPVHRGARIGVVSATAGHCVPLTCLHWGAISGRAYRDPLSLLGFSRPILLPLG